MTSHSLHFPQIFLVLALPACGSGDLVLPGGPPTMVTAVSGDGQRGPPGSRLPDPLVVEVTDADGRLVTGTSVEFSFAGAIPGGAVTPGAAETDEQGRASAEVKLGTVVGNQLVEARAAGGSDSTLRVRFSLTALQTKNPGGGGNGGNDGNGGDGGGGGGGNADGGRDGGGDGGGHGHDHGHGHSHDEDHDDRGGDH
jgi:hypothetical protein